MNSPASDRPLFDDPDAYEDFMGRYSNLLAREFVGVAGVAPGERVLDVGCGTGALTSVLAEIVGAERVAGVDPTEPFVEQAKARVPGADIRVGPAEHLPFDAATFDRTLSQLVFAFVADPAASATEMRRVTKPGGIAAACMWDFTGGMTMMKAFWDAIRDAAPDVVPPPRRFGGESGALAGLWRDTGFGDVTEGTLTVSADYRDFDDFLAALVHAQGPIGQELAALDESARAKVLAGMWERLGSPEGAFSLPASAWYATGIA